MYHNSIHSQAQGADQLHPVSSSYWGGFGILNSLLNLWSNVDLLHFAFTQLGDRSYIERFMSFLESICNIVSHWMLSFSSAMVTLRGVNEWQPSLFNPCPTKCHAYRLGKRLPLIWTKPPMISRAVPSRFWKNVLVFTPKRHSILAYCDSFFNSAW